MTIRAGSFTMDSEISAHKTSWPIYTLTKIKSKKLVTCCSLPRKAHIANWPETTLIPSTPSG